MGGAAAALVLGSKLVLWSIYAVGISFACKFAYEIRIYAIVNYGCVLPPPLVLSGDDRG